ncbi:BTB/POZ domain-containing protein [Ditylenchus destructor]|nr:BTB/POZ domain-containing protein [Ditylenchus destructor]
MNQLLRLMDGQNSVNNLDVPSSSSIALTAQNVEVSKKPCTETGPCTEAHLHGACPFLIADRDNYQTHMIVAEDYFLPNSSVEYGSTEKLRRWLGPCRWTHMPRGIQCDVYLPDSNKEVWAEGLFIHKEGRVTKLPRKVCGKDCRLLAEHHTHSLDYAPHSPGAVLRILEKKDHVRDDFEENWAADVKFLVKRSDYSRRQKAKQSEIELKDIEPWVFDDFLLAIWRKPVKPNPVNVVPLLELADRFDVSILRDSCERHLMLCYEIPLIHRLILSQKYSLSNLQDFLAGNITPEYWSKLQSSKHCKIDDLNSRTLSKITTNLAQQLLSTDDEPKYKKPRRRDSEASLDENKYYC